MSLRAQKGLAQRQYVNVYSTAGVAANPTTTPVSVSVTVTRLSDGATLVTNAAASYDNDPGVFYYDLSPVDSTSQIDTLTLTWSYTLDGVAQTQTDTVDVVGRRLALPRMIDDSLSRGGTASNYTARKIKLALTVAENMFEGATNKTWTTRFGRTTLDGPNWWRDSYTYPRAHFLTLPEFPVTAIRAVTVNSTPYTAAQVAALVPYKDGRVFNPSTWRSGHGNVVIDYEYGETETPPQVARAVTLIATQILADGPWDDRGFGVTTDGGFVRLLTAGVGGAAFSIPEVQAAVQQFGRRNAERILWVDTL